MMLTIDEFAQMMNDLYDMFETGTPVIYINRRTRSVVTHHLGVADGVTVLRRIAPSLSRNAAARKVCAPGMPKRTRYPDRAMSGLRIMRSYAGGL